uniref:Uncharacterized protein n=1 Tax=Oryza meridionalis TaxID=40149 RepID=A0A0E0EQQ9_9ORYZ
MPVVAASLACNTIKRVSNCGNVTSESQIFSNPSSRSQKDTLKTERLGNISCNIVGTYSTGDIVIPSPKYIFNKSSTCNSVRLDMTLSGIVFIYKNLSLMRNPRHLGTSDIEKLYDKLRYSKFVKEHSSSAQIKGKWDAYFFWVKNLPEVIHQQKETSFLKEFRNPGDKFCVTVVLVYPQPPCNLFPDSKGSGAGLSSPSILPRYHKDVPANPYPNKCNPISLWHVTCINRRKETKVKIL